MKLNNIILLLFLFIIVFSCKKESPTIIYSLSKLDSLKVSKSIDNLSENYSDNNDTLVFYSNKIISEYPNNKAELCAKIAHLHFSKSNYYLAQLYFDKSAQKYLNDSLIENYAEQVSNAGVVKEMSGLYTEAIQNYLKSLRIFDSLNLDLKLSRILNNIGIVYQQLNENKKSLEYYHKSLNITEKLGKHDISAIRYNNIATLYEESENNIDSALFYYNKALNIWKNDSNSNNLGIVLNNIGYVYLVKNNIGKADSLFEESLIISNKNNNKNNKSFVLRNKALLLIKKADYTNAISYIKESILITRDIKNKEAEMKSLKVLADAYEHNNEYKLANSTLKELHLLNDELSGVKQKLQINKLNIQYSVREKEHQINILELKNNVQNKKLMQLWLLIAALTFLLTGVIVIYRLHKKNSKLEMQHMRRDIADYLSQIEELKEKHSINIENQQKDIIEKLKQYGLTETEEKVLLLISKGYKNTEIAEKMFVSINTIKTHTKNIFIKLDVRNRIEAARKAQII